MWPREWASYSEAGKGTWLRRQDPVSHGLEGVCMSIYISAGFFFGMSKLGSWDEINIKLFSLYYWGCRESSWPIKLYIYMKIRTRVLVVPCRSSNDVLRSRLSSRIDTSELASWWGCSCLLFCDVTSEFFKTQGYHRRCSLGECLTFLIFLVLHDCCALFSASYHSSFLECSSILPPVVI